MIGEFYTFCEKIPEAQKAQDVKQATFFTMFLCAQKAQKATFFILDVFMCTKSIKSTRRQAFLPLRRFMRIKMLSFLFTYVRFVLFVPNKQLSSS